MTATRPSLLLERRPPPLTWQAARILLAGSSDQAFLDHAWIGRVLNVLPTQWRYPIALRILGLSPHYFIHQWTSAYPKRTKRRVVLEAEAQRSRDSRKQIVDGLLAPYLQAEVTVLDFGCGPGFLAKQLSPYVDSVLALDVSRGTIACALQLNPAPNISYLVNASADLSVLGDNSVDLAISFAVFQHLSVEHSLRFLQEFHRVLRPGGSAVCQFAVGTTQENRVPDQRAGGRSLRARYRLNFHVYTEDELASLLEKAGFANATICPVHEVAEIADDVGYQHLAILRRQAVAPPPDR